MTHIGSYAHVLLPGVSFAEKEGTFTSMERRIQRVRQAIAPVGEARPDWKILCDLSTRMGYPMTYQTPAEVMDEIASLVPSYASATYPNLEKDGIQWPLMSGKKKRFFPVETQEPVEQPSEKYPLWIIPSGFHLSLRDRNNCQEGKGTGQGLSGVLLSEIHPEDATQAGMKDGDLDQSHFPPGRGGDDLPDFRGPSERDRLLLQPSSSLSL